MRSLHLSSRKGTVHKSLQYKLKPIYVVYFVLYVASGGKNKEMKILQKRLTDALASGSWDRASRLANQYQGILTRETT
jgi:hypothetical protein